MSVAGCAKRSGKHLQTLMRPICDFVSRRSMGMVDTISLGSKVPLEVARPLLLPLLTPAGDSPMWGVKTPNRRSAASRSCKEGHWSSK